MTAGAGDKDASFRPKPKPTPKAIAICEGRTVVGTVRIVEVCVCIFRSGAYHNNGCNRGGDGDRNAAAVALLRRLLRRLLPDIKLHFCLSR